jgi:L-malate glycosyltransferase
MRVLQLVHKPQRRGAEIFAFDLARSLNARGTETRIAYLYP